MSPSFHRLFFAIRPPTAVAAHIGMLRDRLAASGTPVGDGRLHMTIAIFDDHRELPPDLVAGARAGGNAAAECPRFRIVLDRVIGGGHAMLLAPSEPVRGLAAFQKRFAAALARAGLKLRVGWRFSPHVTLLYHHGLAPRAAINGAIDPVSWTAGELFLVQSIVGQTRHVTLERWPLHP